MSRFSFKDYTSIVKKTYETRKKSGGLSKNLRNPTTANLKDECLHVLEKHWNNRDKSILKEFLNGQERDSQQEYIQCIRNTPADNFKPVQKWIIGPTGTPTDRIIEMTALILNIQPRPFNISHNYNLEQDGIEQGEQLPEQEEQAVNPQPRPFNIGHNYNIEQDEIEQGEQLPKQGEQGKEATPPTINPSVGIKLGGLSTLNKQRNTTTIISTTVIVSCMLWILFNYAVPFQDKTCMYWAGDHYEKIDCNQKIPNVMAIALDTFQLNHFKKINQIDTLTEDCIGKMWYSKVDNDIEFFTMGGMHPTHHQKALKPVSEYIFNKYIVKDL